MSGRVDGQENGVCRGQQITDIAAMWIVAENEGPQHAEAAASLAAEMFSDQEMLLIYATMARIAPHVRARLQLQRTETAKLAVAAEQQRVAREAEEVEFADLLAEEQASITHIANVAMHGGWRQLAHAFPQPFQQ